MRRYSKEAIEKVQTLRSQGLTYREINQSLGLAIPKSTLAYLCKNVDPGDDYRERVKQDTLQRLVFIRVLAVKKNKQIFEAKLSQMRTDSQYAGKLIGNKQVAKIALAMLYLGEGAKWKSRSGLLLGSSDARIIRIYLHLLEECYDIKKEIIRCTVQHRADQDGAKLLTYWSQVVGVPKTQFYPNYIDKRTIGKPTKKVGYKGVCAISCAGTNIQLELDVIADIISDTLGGISSVG